MNSRCTICDAILRRPTERCPECGARGIFQTPTSDSPRHAKRLAGESHRVWEFSPSGAVLKRID